MTLKPRPIHYEPTMEQQRAAFARARRKALHLQLHDYYRQIDAIVEDVFGGKMNLPPERSESETGCSLTQPFVSWLETHELPDATESRRRRQLWQALSRLQTDRPDLLLIVETHSRTHVSLTKLAERWRIGNKTCTEGFAEGVELLLGYLGES